MGKGYCKECNDEVTIHADGTTMCGCTTVELSEDMPDNWKRQEEIKAAIKREIKGQIIDRLYNTDNLISIAAILEIAENEVNRIHESYIRRLEGAEFDHTDFVDYLIEKIDNFDQIDWISLI